MLVNVIYTTSSLGFVMGKSLYYEPCIYEVEGQGYIERVGIYVGNCRESDPFTFYQVFISTWSTCFDHYPM